MPFRCRTCQKITLKAEPHADCPDQDSCNFETIALIHFVSPDGAYKQVGQGQRVGNGQEGNETVTLQPMKLHCKSVATIPAYTNVACAVTCPACIATFPPEIEEEVEE